MISAQYQILVRYKYIDDRSFRSLKVIKNKSPTIKKTCSFPTQWLINFIRVLLHIDFEEVMKSMQLFIAHLLYFFQIVGCLSRWFFHRFSDPVQIRWISVFDFHRNHFSHAVWVVFAYECAQLLHGLRGCFDHEQIFQVLIDTTFPFVN